MLKLYIKQRICRLLDTATEIKVTVSGADRKAYSNEYETVELANFTIKIPSNVK